MLSHKDILMTIVFEHMQPVAIDTTALHFPVAVDVGVAEDPVLVTGHEQYRGIDRKTGLEVVVGQ